MYLEYQSGKEIVCVQVSVKRCHLASCWHFTLGVRSAPPLVVLYAFRQKSSYPSVHAASVRIDSNHCVYLFQNSLIWEVEKVKRQLEEMQNDKVLKSLNRLEIC